MGDYLDGKRSAANNTTETKVIQMEQQPFDLNALAAIVSNAVSNAVSQIPQASRSSGHTGHNYVFEDKEEVEFDDSKTMDKMANAMIVQRFDKASNFEELGDVKTTKKDQKELDATLDLLENLDD